MIRIAQDIEIPFGSYNQGCVQSCNNLENTKYGYHQPFPIVILCNDYITTMYFYNLVASKVKTSKYYAYAHKNL